MTPETATLPSLRPSGEFLRAGLAGREFNLAACFGCKKCTNGCPLTFAMDLLPYQVVRLAQFGQVEQLLAARTPWVCASCQTCLTRCPNQVDLPGFMDWLKEKLFRAGAEVGEARTLLFHRLFLEEVAKRGRVFEGSLLTRFLLKSGGALGPEAIKNARLGWEMLRRGRIKLVPPRLRRRRWLKGVFASKEARP